MVRHARSRRIGLSVTCLSLLLAATAPLLLGQGCPGGGILPLNPGMGSDSSDGSTSERSDSDSTGTGNSPPFFEFTRPVNDLVREIGDVIVIKWTAFDADDNAVITLLLDPDMIYNNGDEILIEPMLLENDVQSYSLDTLASRLDAGTYRLVARVNDGVNPELIVVAPGMLRLFPPGMIPGNLSPIVFLTQPDRNLGVGHNETVPIAYCVRDGDNGEDENGAQVDPWVLVMLDLDDNPNNDLSITSPEANNLVREVCDGDFPADFPKEVVVDGQLRAYVLGCVADPDCTGANQAVTFPPGGGGYTIDASKIPTRADGLPYRVRVTAWDVVNPPVHAYAPGSISVTAMASARAGVIDLAQVGRTVSGTRFLGWDAGALAGHRALGIGDFNGDGADDFLIVARYGRPFERGNIGSVYLVYGTQGEKFANEINLNSVGTDYHGAVFAMNRIAGSTQGIESIAWIPNLGGDGKPEILLGMPYVEGWYDYWDDDPCDCGPPCDLFNLVIEPKPYICYKDVFPDGTYRPDMLPNPMSSGSSCPPDCSNPTNDDMGDYDGGHLAGRISEALVQRECLLASECSNDGKDPWLYADPSWPVFSLDHRPEIRDVTRIDQGYVLYIDSSNNFDDSIIELGFVGMHDPPATPPCGTLITDELLPVASCPIPIGATPRGVRMRGGWWFWDDWDTSGERSPLKITTDNEFGRTIASMPPLSSGGNVPTRDSQWEVLISAPGAYKGRGAVYLMYGADYWNWGTDQTVQSWPWNPRSGLTRPEGRIMKGEAFGDRFGYASMAGDFNLDGSQDILLGAPGADRDGLVDNGMVYIIYGRVDMGHLDMSQISPPRIEIHGTRSGDQFGERQTIVGDINHDGLPDIAFGSPYAGDDGPGGTDSGFIGIVFGGRMLTGEEFLTVNQVGTLQLPGCRIYGSQAGGHAGMYVNNAGDFNGDGTDDLIVVAADETRVVGGILRRGVAYLIFGGTHMYNQTFTLSEVGSSRLPGIVFVGAYEAGGADDAPINWAGTAGDVNADGFDDILIGAEQADFVNPLVPTQRRVDAGECYLVYGSNSGSNVAWAGSQQSGQGQSTTGSWPRY